MCDPVTITAVTVVASTAFQMQTQKKQGRYRKGVAEYNARVAENQAEDTRRVGTEKENVQRRKTAELLSKQRAQLGASNVELGSGSALQLQEDTLALGEADALRIRSNTGAQVGSLQTGSELTRSQGEYAQQAGSNQATGTFLSGVGQVADTGVADKWFTPNSAAVTTGTDLSFSPTSTDLSFSPTSTDLNLGG